MNAKETARRCGNSKRANTRPGRTQASIAQNEWDWAMKRLGWVLGICFGVMFAIALIAG
jgi:hypothetical protein